MANPILTQLNQMSRQMSPANAQGMGGNMMGMLSQFAEFKRQMQGRDPRQMVENLLGSGRMSAAQFEQLKQQAAMLQNLLK